MALARVLQTYMKESGSPTGVFCNAVQDLQWCMAPLLAINSDEIVGASLLSPIGEECRTSPTPEEEAILLGNFEIELP